MFQVKLKGKFFLKLIKRIKIGQETILARVVCCRKCILMNQILTWEHAATQIKE